MDLKGNPTSDMGKLQYKLASYEEFKSIDNREKFIESLENKAFSKKFIDDFNTYIKKYGVRGFMEIDVASKRKYEDLPSVYDELKEINIEENQIITTTKRRKKAYDKLLSIAKDKGFAKKFELDAKKFQETFGYREHPKYMIVYAMGKLHDAALIIGNKFVEEGRLDNPHQIFDLTLNEISNAQKDSNINLQLQREKNLAPYKKVSHVKDWPLVIDSRGKIFKAKLEINEGDIKGDPIAPGKIKGRAKVLNSPYEKPLNPGEILITKCTEPSWTPIFINAAGVIMEVGGPLQHGGIIAREYGIPCVSGLMGIMEMIKDGDLIELDGSNGIVRILER
jgi:pyruvate,water dikinase